MYPFLILINFVDYKFYKFNISILFSLDGANELNITNKIVLF